MNFGHVDFRDKEQPEKVGVVFEKDPAISVTSQFQGRGSQAGVEFKSHGFRYHGV
jgi:hypothetical protein